ncbi:hypothetical protein DS2_06231 [Catenovulum agarivorans DS-2]|uniref:Peptidase C39 domain-containing protein n=1 Tax=Catenovulum agarivorans DS-2 TaxID=1328313 RepID=W7QG35_9ALTE|nr:PA2778 family cysteine peptidase [Catenovulum agarivorans]EWH10866.1 hypothetical protein DS2_06231 [Catenovulum agarivorans DS-2]
MLLRLAQQLVTIAALLAFVVGCSSTPQTQSLIHNPPSSLNNQLTKQLNVPFFAQQDYFCGPTTLAEIFNYYGHSTTPEQVAPTVFLPKRQGSLQIEMTAATRKNGLLAYSVNGSLEQLVQLVHDNIPVIVLQNLSVEWQPLWHYAVVIGFDIPRKKIIMHSGTNQARAVDMAVFERTWRRADYWLLAPLTIEKNSQALEPLTYLTAAHDFSKVKQHSHAVNFLQQAIINWPDYWLSYFMLANHYLQQQQPELALKWFSQGLEYGKTHTDYLNNYAYTLSQLGCHKQAVETIEQALLLKPNDTSLTSSYQEILSASKSVLSDVASKKCH